MRHYKTARPPLSIPSPGDNPGNPEHTLRVAALGSCLIACLLVSGACSRPDQAMAGNDKAPQEGKPISVRVARVTTQQIERRVETVGTLLAFEEVTVSSETEGRVIETLADLGDRVKRGQPLCTVHPAEQEYALAQQEAQLRQALDRLGLKNESDRVRDIGEVPEVRKAAADRLDAEQRYNRTRELVAQQIASQQDLDQADARHKSAAAGYDFAVHQAQNLISQVAQFRASAGLARKRLRDTSIEAPFSGAIKERMVHPGQYVKPQTALFLLVNADPLRLRAEVPERMAPWVSVGHGVEVRVEAHPDRVFSGKVSRVSPAVDEQKRTFSIEALIPNPRLPNPGQPNSQELLRPGFYAKAVIQTRKRDRILSIPVAAVLYAYGNNKAFVIDGGKAAARDLKLGERVGDTVEVVEGLNSDEQVAVTELGRLDNGIPVILLSSREAGDPPRGREGK